MKLNLNKRIFWDVDFEQIDFEKHADFVINRVIERGDVEDIRQCRRYYSDDLITKTILNINYLPSVKMYLASAIIGKDITELKCYKNRQLNPRLYPY